jgi:NAD(P)-dependent dehydrogenase (short-subunit alcohol dehydrogenase family)
VKRRSARLTGEGAPIDLDDVSTDGARATDALHAIRMRPRLVGHQALTFRGSLRPVGRFFGRKTADDVLAGVDLAGRVMLVTGADSGIGLETARALATRGARVYLGCMRRETGEAAIERIRARHPNVDVRPIAFDLGDLAAVGAAIDAFAEPALHALICNAGVYGGPYATTKDGFERTLGVCYVGHAKLVLGLRAKLEAGAPSRVVMVSSDNHRWPPTLEWDALPTPPERYTELRAYGQAKLCCVLFASALDARGRDRGVRAYSLHPGDLVATGIDKDSWLLKMAFILARPFSPSPAQAAATSVYVATSADVADRGGRYFTDLAEVEPARAALDVSTQDRLWETTERWLATGKP